MKRPKLLLPWKDGTMMDHVLQTWTHSQVDHVVVIVRKDDEELAEAVRRWPVQLIQPENAPPDMKGSIRVGLQHILDNLQPAPADQCFIAPADLPTLTVELIDHLLAQPTDPSAITVPCFQESPGHPAVFPWPMTSDIFQLAADRGVDHLLKTRPVRKIPWAGPPITDIDTPEEYERARGNRV